MIYTEKIENHLLGAYTSSEEIAKSLNWTIALSEEETEISDIDGGLYEKGFAPMKTDEDKAKEEAERIAQLHLTGADVERALIKALNVDFDDIIAIVQEKQPEQVKMLKAELRANYFYRGNPYVDVLGNMLGLTKGQLDVFFETNDYTKLLPEEKPNEDTTDTDATIIPDEV